jgi:hypothetical protein
MALGSTQSLTELSTRNLLGGKGRLSFEADTSPPTMSKLSRKCGSLDFSQICWPPRPVTGISLPFICNRLAVCVSYFNFFVIYAVHVVSKANRRLVLFRTFCFMKGIFMPEFSNFHFFSGYSPVALIHFSVLESY